ncbi:MAG: methionine--tRNA ligase [Candidatus Buchananbacteria bacterium RBG_13_36_9]|uniref:Methionine--tRNA ligase n=1 Tax=Candidatus Buchananbacteria bacterium RBG_13_36_9 TaxID=1797530 RepID=A0A1G1XQP3_9BACT|nr:MAG: methionine--tRNA ligase [Candidatus Buchananbacteria bacterium RBG_13_36_9]
MPKSTKQKKFYVTTPIYYVNDVPHIGHAYTTVAADVLARYYRMMLGADNVYFLTGTDEHGAKIAQAAEKNKMTPQQFVDMEAAKFQMVWDRLDISNNDFIRTTEERHEKVVIDFWKKLKTAKTPLKNNAIYEAEYEGLYCVGCESFKTKDELIEGKCPDHKTKCELIKEKNWFLKLSDYTDELKKLIDNGELKILPEVRQNEVLGLLNTGLRDVAISRQNVKWGIPLPFDKKQTTYVWIDALSNYISALGGPKGKLYKKFWPADVHLMAKDILKFHALIWPTLLLAMKLPLPKLIFSHGFFTINGQKMSKTIGNVIDPEELVSKYGSDATRYLLLSQFGFGTDGDFSKDRLDHIYNAALANEFGNLVSRVLAMAEKYFDSKVPKYNVSAKGGSASGGDSDKFFEFDIKTDWEKYDFFMKNLKFDEVLNIIWEDVRRCNSYIDKNKPWELAANNDDEVLPDVIFNLLETIRHLALMILPFMPQTCDKILTQLGFDPEKEKEKGIEALRKWPGLKLGQKVAKGESLFPRLNQ